MALTPIPAAKAEVARMVHAPSALAYYQTRSVPPDDARAEAVRAAMAALIEAAFAP